MDITVYGLRGKASECENGYTRDPGISARVEIAGNGPPLEHTMSIFRCRQRSQTYIQGRHRQHQTALRAQSAWNLLETQAMPG